MSDVNIGFEHYVVFVEVMREVDIAFVIQRGFPGEGTEHLLRLGPFAVYPFRAPQFRRA